MYGPSDTAQATVEIEMPGQLLWYLLNPSPHRRITNKINNGYAHSHLAEREVRGLLACTV